MAIKSLIINPGSTSTKIAVYEDETNVFDKTLRHSTEELKEYETIADQTDFRREIIEDALKENDIDINSIDVCVGRGGFLKPIVGGTYTVNDDVMHDLRIGRTGQHASNLGGILAREIADEIGVKAYIVDPVIVDELMPIARVSGIPEIERVSVVHALNQKAIGRRYGKDIGKKYEDMNLIIVHLGGGITVTAHQHGQMVDLYNALDGDGAFTPERSGGLPSGDFMELCYSGKYTKEEMRKKIVGQGGFAAYLGTNNMLEVDHMIEAGDEKAKLIMDAFILQLSKDIGGIATVLKGDVEQILITGGVARDEFVINGVKERCEWIAPITIYPGEDELLALAQGALRVMNGEEEAKEYVK